MVDEVAEPMERTLALDRPLQSLPLVVQANSALESMLGCPSGELKGRSIAEFVAPETVMDGPNLTVWAKTAPRRWLVGSTLAVSVSQISCRSGHGHELSHGPRRSTSRTCANESSDHRPADAWANDSETADYRSRGLVSGYCPTSKVRYPRPGGTRPVCGASDADADADAGRDRPGESLVRAGHERGNDGVGDAGRYCPASGVGWPITVLPGAGLWSVG